MNYNRKLLLFSKSFVLIVLVSSVSNARDHKQHVPSEHIVSFQGGKEVDKDFIDIRSCMDLRDECAEWRDAGYCETDTKYTQIHCPKSCDTCDMMIRRVVPRNESSIAARWHRSRGRSGEIIHNVVGAELGEPQRSFVASFEDVKNHVARQKKYFYNIIQIERQYESVRETCRNYNENCTDWALAGECSKNPDFMRHDQCPLACMSCEDLDDRARCQIDPNVKNAFYPTDLNAMFENIVTNFNETYDITVLSRDPWVVILDGFFSSAEAKHLVGLGRGLGFERSTEVSATGVHHVSKGRTSMTAWCNTDECEEDEIVLSLFNRMEKLTGISMENSESLQLLEYQPGGFYKEHHDYITADYERPQGVRILTIFLYLKEDGDTTLIGGGTRFSKLGITVEPAVGRALIWPSVFDDDPHEPDFRTNHEALEVKQGVKHGANAWIHQRPFEPDC